MHWSVCVQEYTNNKHLHTSLYRIAISVNTVFMYCIFWWSAIFSQPF